MHDYESEADFNNEDEEVECYNECNGFCTRYGLRCPYTNGEKLDCEDYMEE